MVRMRRREPKGPFELAALQLSTPLFKGPVLLVALQKYLSYHTFNSVLHIYIYVCLVLKTKREKALGVNERPWRGYPIQQNTAACGPLVRACVYAMELLYAPVPLIVEIAVHAPGDHKGY